MTYFEYPELVLSDPKGNIFNHPSLKLSGRSGDRFLLPHPSELMPLPPGSQLFTLPGRIPVGWDEERESFALSKKIKRNGKEMECTAVAAFLPPGYIRTLLPATHRELENPVLPLWAYSAVGWKEGRFWATSLLIDKNPHWNPRYFQNDHLLKRKVDAFLQKNPRNRLLRQLAKCAMEYHCFAGKNVFFRRWECPLPTSPSCNADCLGCLSLQSSDCSLASHERIHFVPTLEEVIDVALPHLQGAEDAIISFGQGCEGEPLVQWRLLENAIFKLREKTHQGTINLNTNGSFPERVKRLCEAGLDSIRVTLNSPHPRYYKRYHRPKGYTFRQLIDSLLLAKERGIYTSINLLIFPGFTDREGEVEGWIEFIRQTHIDLIQMRNLNIDPDLYLESIGKGEGIGISKMINILQKEFPSLQFGYFNRTKESFYPVRKPHPLGWGC
jgi:pyruvate-formate lyase-activating enzyme